MRIEGVRLVPFMEENPHVSASCKSIAASFRRAMMEKSLDCERRIKEFSARTGLPFRDLTVIELANGNYHVQWNQAVEYVPKR